MYRGGCFIRRFILCCLILSTFLLIFPLPARAKGQEEVRVGFFEFEGYHMQDEEGNRSGYGYELLQHMSGYTDWKYTYVGYDKSWEEMLALLDRGEIDILTSVQKTEEREKKYDFSKESIGTSSAILTVRAGGTTYTAGNYAKWSGMRVGMLKKNSRNQSFMEFAAKKGFTYTAVYFNNQDELQAAMDDKNQIDAILTSNLRKANNEWILAQFDPAPFYIIVKKGNTKLLSEIDNALENLFNNEPELRTQLMNKYYIKSNVGEVAYTSEERAYIKKMKDRTFTAVINPEQIPYGYLEKGELRGILKDIGNEIINKSKLNIRFADVKNYKEYAEAVKSGKAELCFDAGLQYQLAERQNQRLTSPYMKAPISKLYRKGQKTFYSAAMLADSDVAFDCRSMLEAQGISIVYYDNLDSMVDAVRTGKQDMAYMNSDTALYVVQNEMTNCFLQERVYGHSISYAIAVKASEDPMLYSILNKAVLGISEKEIDEISQKYETAIQPPFSMVSYVYQYPFRVIAIIVAISLVIVLGGFAEYVNKKRKQERKQLFAEKRHNEVLSDALAAAERADTAKSQFLSRVSHEMRTPLNAIIGFLELARDASPEQMEKYLNNSDVAARQLLSVINDVLDMSAIEAGKMKIAHAPFDFKTLIQGITNVYLPLCQQKGIEYETKILTPMDEWFNGDRLRINQIIMNLLGNAVKFTKKGHVWMEISQYDGRQGEAFIHIEVSDTGCGMSEEMKKRLFLPFEQESTGTAREYGGSGLGLSIVKNLIHMMDGAIRVESIQDKGTRFILDLPLIKSKAVRVDQIPEHIEKIRVLAVDDEENERNYLADVFTRLKVRFTCVENGEDALWELDKAEEEHDPYNICLVDWEMMHMNGIETTRRIRENYGRDVIVIVVSAYEQHQADENARRAGADLFISKPLFQSTLLDLFMTLTGGKFVKKSYVLKDYNFEGKRVLLAEDNAMNRMVAAGILQKLGVECDLAEDGQSVVDKFAASKPGYYDVILMDVQMPKLDGYKATRMIRESSHEDAEKISIIALTANAFHEDIARSLSNGMNDHIAKPIEPELLAQALKRAFDK